MITIKTPQEIEIMAQGGRILANILQQMKERVVPGVTTLELDQFAEKRILECGGMPSFKLPVAQGGGGFPATACISVNDEVVHGVPSSRILKDGDVVTLDIGMVYQGFHTDTALSCGVGTIGLETQRMMRVAKKSLKRAIKKARPGNTFGDIGNTVERYVEDQGFHVVRDLCGHGIGKKLHEDPQILNYGKRHKGPVIKEGMTFCIEPMITAGDPSIILAPNKWTYCIKDGSNVVHYEHTLAVFADGCHILTDAGQDEDDQDS